MIARLLRWLRASATRTLEDRINDAQAADAPLVSSVFARDVLHALIVAGLDPSDAVRALRPFEVTGTWLGPYTLYGTRPVTLHPERFPGVQTRRRARLLHRDGTGSPSEVPVLLATLYAVETETCALPADLDAAWREVIRVAFHAAERSERWDMWVEPEGVEPELDEPAETDVSPEPGEEVLDVTGLPETPPEDQDPPQDAPTEYVL